MKLKYVLLILLPLAFGLGMASCGGSTQTQMATMTGGWDKIFGRYPCNDIGTIAFDSLFFSPNLITTIVPMGKVAPQAGHVTPTDHLYVHRDPPLREDADYVLAPGGGAIVEIARFPDDQPLIAGDESAPKVPDYRVTLMHSCTFFTMFIHLGELAPAIAEQTGEIPLSGRWFAGKSGAIEVKSGQPIAKFGGDSFDWSVHDADTTLPGFVIPEHYGGAPWKIHTVDPFQFYADPVQSDLLSKVPREAEPRAGRIDYDVEGTIVGNWFLEGTVDYRGNLAPDATRYWKGHLSIVYGHIDPRQIRISIGLETGIRKDLCNICFGAYGVRGNQPDPATVGPESGIIKYELMSRRDSAGYDYVIKEQLGTTSLGTFLVRHFGDRTIRVEVIPGKSPDEVEGFSDASLIYRR